MNFVKRPFGRPMPAVAYFSGIALLTLLGVATAMQFRPAFAHDMRRFLGLEKPLQDNPGSFYAVRVTPLLETRCNSCHGDAVRKAGLRLDSFDPTMRGGKHGPVVAPGNVAASELFTRITLPPSDDRAMPPSGKPPLTREEVTVIRLWIAAGASGTQPVTAIKGAPRLVEEVRIPETDMRAVERQRAALAAMVQQLQARYPGVITYESRDSADLEVNASLKGTSFGDSDLAALAPLAARIVRADFSGTAITDASAPVLATMPSLRLLRLRDTRTTDATTQALAPLRQKKVAIYGGDDAQ